MLTALGLIGKAVEFLVTSISKKMDLALDEKKRAAKAFVRLHEAIRALEVLGDEFLLYIEGLKNGRNSRMYSVHLRRIAGPLKPASIEFEEALRELSPVLSFYDPALQRALGEVAVGKTGLLKNFFYLVQGAIASEMAAASANYREPDESPMPKRELRFDIAQAGGAFCSLDLTVPREALIETSTKVFSDSMVSGKTVLDEEEDEDADVFGVLSQYAATGSGERVKIQVDLFEVVRANLEPMHIDYLEIDKLIDLYPRLKRQQEVIGAARESLRAFVQANFSLTDVLYVGRE